MGILAPTDTDLKFSPTTSDNFRTLILPTGVSINSGVSASYAKRKIRGVLAGWASHPLLFLSDESVHTVGIDPPSVAPVMVAGSGTGITGNAIGYLSYIHKMGYETIHESDLSLGSATQALVDDNRSWSGLPLTAPNPRVTHISGWVSMDGALPRRAWTRELGTATVVENVPTATLVALDAPPVDTSGNLTNARWTPPACRWVVVYKRRMWYLGDPANPDRAWYSEVDEFESVGRNNYIDTDGGESITGAAMVGDQLVLGCVTCVYEVRGYGSSDFALRKIHPKLGVLSHFGMVVVNTNGSDILWFPSQRGYVLYDGSFRFVMEDYRSFWKDDIEDEVGAYMKMIACEDPEYGVVKALVQHVSDATTKSHYYVAHYDRWHEDPVGAPQPDWTRDLRARQDTAMGLIADGTGRRVLYVGSSDGVIRKENIGSDPSDDSDTFLKRFRLRTFFNMMGEPGGAHSDGRVWKELWVYLKSELCAWVPKIFTGDPAAGDATTPTVSPGTQPASAGTDGVGNTLLAKSVHPLGVNVAGRGVALEITIDSPLEVVFDGWGGTVTPGQAESRGIV